MLSIVPDILCPTPSNTLGASASPWAQQDFLYGATGVARTLLADSPILGLKHAISVGRVNLVAANPTS